MEEIGKETKLSLEDLILKVEDFLALDLPERPVILHPWLKEKSNTLISGWRGAGKTWFIITLMNAVTRGLMFGPWETITPVPCLYIDGELNDDEIQERLKSIQIGERKVPLYIYNECLMKELGCPKASLLDPNWRDKILNFILTHKIGLTGFDNLSALTGGANPYDENTKKDWAPINDWLIDVKHKGCANILVHHTGKGGDQRGTSEREDNIDTSILLAQPKDYRPEQGCRFVLKFTKKRTHQSEANLIQDHDFQLKEEDGKVDWEVSGHKGNTDLEILKMLSDGIKQSDIAKAFGITPPAITKKKNGFIAKGWLDSEGKITPVGKHELESSDWMNEEADV